ncbi:hypothetical protein NE850_34780 [Paraburkholderia sp. USG1]|uniref:hypothetical protein n=1 Tax=Paraburkholderia sp. USG1 TaxID=2952268 RepID=UPI002861261C|nr:hypothetical protein [Paraburkholderia sp. USG1]MDR8401499.1 hypothetical protein [Paraburkholderia sp. USG1]
MKLNPLHITILVVTAAAAFLLGGYLANIHINARGADNIRPVILGKENSDANNYVALRVNPYDASAPIYSEFNDYRKWLLNNKDIKAANGAADPIGLMLLSGQLAAKGMPRLPTDLLEQRFSSVNKILPSLDNHVCATLIKGNFDATEFTAQSASIMNSFNAEEAKAWFSVGRAAIEAQLHRSPVIVLSTEDATRSIVKIAKSMYAPQSKEFIERLAGLKTASDEEACATVRIFYSQGNSLPEPYRGYIARMLLTGSEGNERI